MREFTALLGRRGDRAVKPGLKPAIRLGILGRGPASLCGATQQRLINILEVLGGTTRASAGPKSKASKWRHDHEERYRVVMGMSDMPNPSYDQAKRCVQALGPADQLRLIAELVGRLSSDLDRRPCRSLLELQGLGKGVWQGVDVDEYLRRERSSWSG